MSFATFVAPSVSPRASCRCAFDEDPRLEVVRDECPGVPDPREDLLLRAGEERLELFRPQAESAHRIDPRLQRLRGLLISAEAFVEGDREGLRLLRRVKGLRELVRIEESFRDLQRVF